MNIQYTRCTSQAELIQILQLQKVNLPGQITAEEKISEGFVTVSHSLELLGTMNEVCPHIIAIRKEQLVGYALCMDKIFAKEIPVLRPMFEKISLVLTDPLSYMVMGQICVDKSFRKKGVFRGLYNSMRLSLEAEFDLIITEVDAANSRSLQAHYAIGFRDLLVYNSGGQCWHLLGWEI